MINRLAKLDVSMLTFLCVRNFVLNIDHIIALNKINSLGVLILEKPLVSRGVADNTMSAKDVLNWGRSVRESGAFQMLKVLVFGDFGPERSAVLKAASDFPALTLVGVLDNWARYKDQPDHVMNGSYGGWCPTKSESDGLDVWSLWMDRKTTKAQKTQQLYDYSLELSRKSRTDLSLYQSISMFYNLDEGHKWDIERGEVAWYHLEPEQNGTHPTTRPRIKNGSKDKSDVREGSHHKKRKVREGRGVDIGSLLGSFT
jgi:hypothetical protein